jgi:hypothetical protein
MGWTRSLPRTKIIDCDSSYLNPAIPEKQAGLATGAAQYTMKEANQT